LTKQNKFEKYTKNEIYRPISSQMGVDPSRDNNIFVLSKFLARATSRSVQAVAIRHLNY
jgi:hypothetical protein